MAFDLATRPKAMLLHLVQGAPMNLDEKGLATRRAVLGASISWRVT